MNSTMNPTNGIVGSGRNAVEPNFDADKGVPDSSNDDKTRRVKKKRPARRRTRRR